MIKITIKKLGINGEGIGYYKKKITFIPGALPDEVVMAEVEKETERYIDAKLVKVLQKSLDRVEPPCPIYHECGGCQIMHLDEEAHAMYKKHHLMDALMKYSTIPNIEQLIAYPLMAEEPYYYRNKAQLQLKRTKERVIIGLYAPASHKVVDLGNCLVQNQRINKIVKAIGKILTESPIEIGKKGLLHLVVRVSEATGEAQVTYVTPREDLLYLKDVIYETSRIKNVVTVAISIKKDDSQLIFGDRVLVKKGQQLITEKLGNLTFSLAPRDFFQLNPKQTVVLYDEVKKIVSQTKAKKIVDCYCGTGTIGQYVAGPNTEVRGMDIVPTAIESAKKNAVANNIKKYRYEVGDAKLWLGKWHKEGFTPDVLIVDPPRTGLDKDLINTIIASKAKTLVYISCNPSTLGKNLKFLKKYYTVKSIQPVDMFPNTAHVETVVWLSKTR